MANPPYDTPPATANSSEPPEGTDNARPLYPFLGAMLLTYMVIEILRRILHSWEYMDMVTRDILGLLAYLPLVVAVLRLHRFLVTVNRVRNTILLALFLLMLSQVSDIIEEFPWGEDSSFASVRFLAHDMTDSLLMVVGGTLIVGASYVGLVETEAGRRRTAYERAQLERETEERRLFERELRQVRDDLETRVRERTLALAESNQRLAEQVIEIEEAHAEVEESRNLLREIERITQCGAWEINTETEAILCTEEFRRIFGFSEDAALTTAHVAACFPPEALYTVLEVRQRAENEGIGWELELPIVRTDGARRWVRTKGLPSKDMEALPLRLTGTAQDITVRKAADFENSESANLLQAVVKSAPIFLWTLDMEGRFTMNVGSGLQQLGMQPGELVGVNLFEHNADNPGIINLARRALSGEPCSAMIESDGLSFQTTYSPLFDAHGNLAGAIGVAMDVTKQQLVEVRRRQQQKMESLGVLAGGIAHDFNNILYAMDGFAALAAKQVDSMSTAAECLSELRHAVKRATTLVDRILAFSRQEEPRQVSVDLGHEAKKTLKLFEQTSAADVEFKLEVAPDAPNVLGDPAYIQRILANLCANGIYAMRNGGGTLTISIKPGVFNRDFTEYPELRGMACAVCEVKDTGTGIEPQLTQRLFEPFFSTKPLRDGTGLGLAIVHNLVQSHRGIIKVESTIGEGSTFTVMLPAAAKTDKVQTDPPLPAIISAELGPPRRIVVVEDEPQVRHLLELLLGDAGHIVQSHASGSEALQALESSPPPDVVLADLTMPEMSGLDLLQAVAERYPHVPVVLCSGHVDALQKPEILNSGAVAFVRKPIDPAAVLELVAKVTHHNEETSAV